MLKDYDENRRYESSWNSSNVFHNAIEMYRSQGKSEFANELRDELRWGVDAESKTVAEKMAAKFESLGGQGILRDSDVWLALDEDHIAYLLNDEEVPGAERIALIRKLVDEDIDEERAAREEKADKERKEREERNRTQCSEKVYSGGRNFHSSQCSKKGRFIVDFKDGSQTRKCGQHIKFYGSCLKTGDSIDGKTITKITDTKGETTFYSPQEVATA